MRIPPKLLTIVAAALIAGGSFYAGIRVAEERIPFPDILKEPGAPQGVDPAPLWKAWRVLDEKFVPATTTNIVSDEEKLWGAVKGLVDSVKDPYTVFLPPEDAEIFEDDISGNFQGVGMEIGIRDEALTVVAPLKGTPAERAGLRAGDRILEIDGVATGGMAVDKAVKRIRGERGTTVVFLIGREGVEKPFPIPVVRDVIEIPTIDTLHRPDGVFVIAVHNFSAVAPHLFRQALREFVEANTDKMVIDLRDNPGGFLEAAVDMASWFLPPGRVVVREDFGPDEEQRIHRSKGYDVFNENLKIVILVNGGSASASEIFAGALQEYDRASLVGEKTFGKGSVQELVMITDESSLKVTIAQWLTPSGRSISEGGLKPDHAVSRTEKDREMGADPQMEKAAELLLAEPHIDIVNTVNPFR